MAVETERGEEPGERVREIELPVTVTTPDKFFRLDKVAAAGQLRELEAVLREIRESTAGFLPPEVIAIDLCGAEESFTVVTAGWELNRWKIMLNGYGFHTLQLGGCRENCCCVKVDLVPGKLNVILRISL